MIPIKLQCFICGLNSVMQYFGASHFSITQPRNKMKYKQFFACINLYIFAKMTTTTSKKELKTFCLLNKSKMRVTAAAAMFEQKSHCLTVRKTKVNKKEKEIACGKAPNVEFFFTFSWINANKRERKENTFRLLLF